MTYIRDNNIVTDCTRVNSDSTLIGLRIKIMCLVNVRHDSKKDISNLPPVVFYLHNE